MLTRYKISFTCRRVGPTVYSTVVEVDIDWPVAAELYDRIISYKNEMARLIVIMTTWEWHENETQQVKDPNAYNTNVLRL